MDEALEARTRLVDHLLQSGAVRNSSISAAMRDVPRHLFLPGVPLHEAYADRVVVLKELDGRVISSASQPAMIAQMLELLEIVPGSRILEVGTGSGYNAALMAYLTGKAGSVTTADLEPDLVARARDALVRAGYSQVEVAAADGTRAVNGGADYDRIVVTACANDIARAWWDQLATNGRLVLPLDFSTGQYAIAFVRDGSTLRSDGAVACAFVPLRGESVEPATPNESFVLRPLARYAPLIGMRTPRVQAFPTSELREHASDDADAMLVRPVTTFALRWE